jgi:hypothetical protein
LYRIVSDIGYGVIVAGERVGSERGREQSHFQLWEIESMACDIVDNLTVAGVQPDAYCIGRTE